jgi:hypothetical protein
MTDAASRKLDAVRTAADRLATAQNERDAAIRQAAEEASIRKVAAVAGLSHQRVHQIVHGR